MAGQQVIRFATPPVRTVRLAYYFQTPEPMLGVHVGALFDLWRHEYPVADELPPRAPIGSTTDEVSVLDAESRWPTPFVTLENPESGRSVFYQYDRFGLVWDFDQADGADTRYPGYEALAAEMTEKYELFCNALDSRGAGPPHLRGAECFYSNRIEDVSFADYVVGYLSGWTNDAPCPARPMDEGLTFSRHLHGGGNSEYPIWISAASEENNAMTLRLTVRTEDESEQEPSTALRAAHDILIDSFVESTSGAMREAWGPM